MPQFGSGDCGNVPTVVSQDFFEDFTSLRMRLQYGFQIPIVEGLGFYTGISYAPSIHTITLNSRMMEFTNNNFYDDSYKVKEYAISATVDAMLRYNIGTNSSVHFLYSLQDNWPAFSLHSGHIIQLGAGYRF